MLGSTPQLEPKFSTKSRYFKRDNSRCAEKLPAAITTGRMQQQRRREREREISFSSTARRAKTAARDGLSRDNIFSGGRPEKQTDRRSSTSLQPNALASQQPIYMTLFMDVIGFESWSQPLGGILSESGAFAQLAQGMAPFLEGQFWHCVGI